MAESPLTDREIRILRGMIDQHETERLVDAWWVSKWKALQITIAGLSALAVVTASVIELVNLVR